METPEDFMGVTGPDVAAVTLSEGVVTRIEASGLFTILNETHDDYEYGPLPYGFFDPAIGSTILIAHGGNLTRIWVVGIDGN